jgi:hypothetical protein
MISEQSSREDWWAARRDSGAFRVLACLLTGGGRDMFPSRLEYETIFRHRQAGGTFAGTIQRHPRAPRRGSVPARGVFRTSLETLKNADCLTDAEKLPLFREAEQDWQRAIEAVREVENKREQERRARAARRLHLPADEQERAAKEEREGDHAEREAVDGRWSI